MVYHRYPTVGNGNSTRRTMDTRQRLAILAGASRFDPKTPWAQAHPERFPVDLNRAGTSERAAVLRGSAPCRVLLAEAV
jgi:hypothetical protein